MLLIVLSFVTISVEARGKGGAANGGGNSWRGGRKNVPEKIIFFLKIDKQ